MRVIIVGLGVQGRKRRAVAGSDAVATVDSLDEGADFTRVDQVPPDLYDAALVCTPDAPKMELLRYFLSLGKHVLVEKPLFAEREEDIAELESIAKTNGAVCHTAYNHRFEPHYVRMRDLIHSGELGEIFHCRMFYGNGTARLARDSEWRDQGAGVLPDLGSHLLDTACYWFGDPGEDFRIVSASCFENRAPDHVVFGSESMRPKLNFEMTLLSWRNHFTCDVLAENGSAHIRSLCKWGPSVFTKRSRILPSGRPPEESVTLVQSDPTWALEYKDFKELCKKSAVTDLTKDAWLNRLLRRLGDDAIREAAA